VEHPTRLLEQVKNLREQVALYGLIFEGLPTYEEILNGTPQLTPTFAFFSRMAIQLPST